MFTSAQLGNYAFTLGKNSLHARRRESALFDPLIKELLVLYGPRAVRIDNDVQFQILRVVANRRTRKGLLKVDVPALECSLGAAPLVPDRVTFAGSVKLK